VACGGQTLDEASRERKVRDGFLDDAAMEREPAAFVRKVIWVRR
jgi:hypothetical protein